MAIGLTAFPPDVVRVLDELGDGEFCRSAYYIATEIGVPEKRVQEIHRALGTLGFAYCGTLMTDEGSVAGRGYWVSVRGEELRDAIALATEARRAATGNTDAVHEGAGPQDNAQ